MVTAVNTMTMTAAICEVCGGSEFTRVPSKWEVMRCSACGLTFAVQSGSEDSPDLYDENFAQESKHPTYIFDGEKYSARATQVWSTHLKKLAPYRKTGRILDIGCSLGFLLQQAKQLGWDPYGVEVSDFAVRYATEKLGLNVTQGILEEDTYEAGFFDAVICSHVMEHVPSPRLLLRRINKILRPGGVALILVPTQFSSLTYRVSGKTRGVGPPLHLFFFSRKTLPSLMEQEGFCVLQSEMNTELAHLVGSFTRNKQLGSRLEEASERIVSQPSDTIAKRIRRSAVGTIKALVNRVGTQMNIGDELIVYAQKRAA